jgi:glycine C-acetyltransferase
LPRAGDHGAGDRYDAIVMVDDCHATGFMGAGGRGTPHHFGVADGVHILTGTLGKALGGAIGGYIAGPRPVIDLLRQRARPYLFSNALPPAVAPPGSPRSTWWNGRRPPRALFDNAALALRSRDARLRPAARRAPDHPGHAGRGRRRRTWPPPSTREGVYVAGFFFPVVPMARPASAPR